MRRCFPQNKRRSQRPAAPALPWLLTAALVLLLTSFANSMPQDNAEAGKKEPGKEAGEARTRELGKIKQEEALRNLQRLEEIMQKLTVRPDERDPANSARLREAFSLAREVQIRESM